MLELKNKTLQPFFHAATQSDWCSPLQELTDNLDTTALQRIRVEAEAEAKKLGFSLQGSQNHLLKIYLGRIRQMCHRRLLNLQIK